MQTSKYDTPEQSEVANHYDKRSEMMLLAAIFKGGSQAWADVEDLLSDASIFTTVSNQVWHKVYETIFQANPTTKLDVATMLATVKTLGLDDYASKKDEIDYLRGITKAPVEPANARPLAVRLKRLHVARLLNEELDSAKLDLSQKNGDSTVSEILSCAENRIFEFGSKIEGQGEGPQKIGKLAREYLSNLEAAGGLIGIPTGFPAWDDNIGGGVLPNSVDIIAARAKTGKSVIKNAIARSVAGKCGIPVLDIDTEMSKEEQIRRHLSALSGVKERHIREGRYKKNEQQQLDLEAALNTFEVMPYYHEYVAHKSLEEILATIRRWLVRDVGLDEFGKAKPCLVLYDYIKLTTSGDMGKDMKEYQSLGFLATALKNLVGKYDARCIAFAQMNRDGLDYDDERALAGSDRLSWFCTSLSYLSWQSDDELAQQTGETYTHKLKTVLSRHGGRQKPKSFINIKTNLSCCLMEEGPISDGFQSY